MRANNLLPHLTIRFCFNAGTIIPACTNSRYSRYQITNNLSNSSLNKNKLIKNTMSSGVVLYGMITGRLPFLCPRDEWTSSEKRRRRLMIQINRGLTSAQEKAMCHTSAECKNLINRLLMPTAHKRIIIREILDHPWILASSRRNFHAHFEKNLNASEHIVVTYTDCFGGRIREIPYDAFLRQT